VIGQAQHCKERRHQEQRKRKDFHCDENAIPLDKECLQRRKLTGSRGVNVIDDGRGHIETLPTGEPAAETEIRIVAVSKEVLVEETDHLEHLAAVDRSSGIRKKNFLALIELTSIGFARTPAVIQAIGID